MSTRILGISGFLVLSAVVVSLAPESLSAQAGAPRTRQVNVPRAADGHPDLSGTYDVATMTPLERPAGLGNRLVLTPEEAAALERYEAARNEKDVAPRRPDQPLPPVGGNSSTPPSYLETLFRAGGGDLGGDNLFLARPGPRGSL